MRRLITFFLLLLCWLVVGVPTSFAQTNPTPGDSSTCNSCFQRPVGKRSAQTVVAEAAAQHRTTSSAGAAYVRSTNLPWGTTGDNSNVAAMNGVFGVGNWDNLFLQSATAAVVFTPARQTVFLEGSQNGAATLSSFLQANQAAIENWVAAGGHLFLNAGPNTGSSFSFGFGGITLNFGNFFSGTGTVVAGHPIAAGPYLPAGSAYSGNYFAHATVSGPGLTTVITGAKGIILGYKAWGSGYVFLGGMTTTNFHSPSPNGLNLRKNILAFTPPCNAPVVTAPAIAAANDAGQCSASVSLSATATGGGTLAYRIGNATIASPYTFPVGTTTVTATATNACGTDSKTFTVTVADSQLPVALAHDQTLALDANGTASLTAAAIDNSSYDNCGIASLALNRTSFSCQNLGPNPVTLTVTDTHGNVSTASAVVTVVDATVPTITAPASVSVSTDAGQCTATGVALGTPVAADNCSATVSNNAPATYAKGTTTVTWTATDAAGNVATATQTVTVNDTELPAITAPAAIVVSTDAGQCSATNIALGTAAFGDNCAGATVSNNAPTAFAKGSTTVTWTATDAAGNTVSATQTVTVNDTQLPTITAPAAVSVSTDAGQCSATGVALGTATAGDNCAGVLVSNNAPATFAKGTTTVTWTATDAAGNVATATQTVTVSDTELPTIAAPVAVSVSTDAGQCSATNVTLGTATFGDNCAGVLVSNNAPATFAKGSTTVTWTATDAAGNTATATQTVTVRDTESPVLTVPANLTANAPANLCGAVVSFSTTATDNCGATVVASPASGSTFAVGTTTVSVTATDGAGNTSRRSFSVTVNDVTAPAVVVRNVTVALNNGAASVTAAQVNNGSTDACAIASVALSRTSFDCSNIGANSVTLTVTDNHGNVASAPAVVTVTGSIPVPTIVATPASVYVSGRPTIYFGYGPQALTLNASGGVSYSWSPATGLSSTTSAAPVFTPTAEGLYTFTLTATSASGCTATTTVKVYVEDVRCGNNNDKVQICHNSHEICVANSALSAHLAHGDKVGMCTPAARPVSLASATLLQAYPNPVADHTTISFRPALAAPAQVRVYDALGREVATLFDGTTEAGRDYVLSFDVRQLAAGLYLCRYESQGQTLTQRIAVVK